MNRTRRKAVKMARRRFYRLMARFAAELVFTKFQFDHEYGHDFTPMERP